jgi:homoserine acetyltransferase
MGVVPMPADFGDVDNQSFTISSFRLQIGAVMPQAKVAYETYCRLAADGRNAALITHGYSQQPSRGRSQSGKRQFAGLVGPAVSASTRGPSSPVARLATDPEPLMGERR